MLINNAVAANVMFPAAPPMVRADRYTSCRVAVDLIGYAGTSYRRIHIKPVFVTFCHGRVGNGRNREGWLGNGAAEKPDRITLFGNGRDRLESPSVGSTPGHPKRNGAVWRRLLAGTVWKALQRQTLVVERDRSCPFLRGKGHRARMW